MQMTLISFNDIPPHEPPLQASSSPIPRIRIWPKIRYPNSVTVMISFAKVVFYPQIKFLPKKKRFLEHED